MRFGDYIRLALRNVARQKLRSALTIFAVAIGATSVTIMLGLVFSVKGFMTKQFEANGTLQQVRVSPQTDVQWQDGGWGGNCNDCKKLTEDLIASVQAVPHVTGVARQVQIGQFEALTYGSQKLRAQQITAYDANGILPSTIIAGRDIADSDKEGVVVLTADYADKLGFKQNYQGLVGKQIGLVAQGWYSGVGVNAQKQAEERQRFFETHPGVDGRDFQPTAVTLQATVVGVMNNEDSSYTIRVPLAWAHGMMQNQSYQVTAADQEAANAKCRNSRGPCDSRAEPTLMVTDELAKNGYTSLVVKVDQATNAPGAASEIRKFGVGAVDAQTYIKSQLAIFNIIGAVLGGIGGISLAVAAVGVINTMVMAILERTREIGVMRAVGAKRATISRLFTFEASLLGFLGGVCGVAVGFGLTFIANPIINKQLHGNNIQSSNIISLPPWLIIAVILATTIIGMLAGLYPARRAAKLDPVEALRYE